MGHLIGRDGAQRLCRTVAEIIARAAMEMNVNQSGKNVCLRLFLRKRTGLAPLHSLNPFPLYRHFARFKAHLLHVNHPSDYTHTLSPFWPVIEYFRFLTLLRADSKCFAYRGKSARAASSPTRITSL